jgi:hypothetical protein
MGREMGFILFKNFYNFINIYNIYLMQLPSVSQSGHSPGTYVQLFESHGTAAAAGLSACRKSRFRLRAPEEIGKSAGDLSWSE